MKQICLLLIALFIVIPGGLFAQGNAASVLAQNAEEERYRILNAKITAIFETQEMLRSRQNELQQRYESLAREIDKLKDAQARGALHSATREDLKKLVETIQEIDRKREADKKLFLDSIRDLAKVAPAPRPEKSAPAPAPVELDGKYFEYVVEDGNTLGGIVKMYNADFEKNGQARITTTQVKKANPDVKDWDKLRAGRKILIPAPAEKKAKGK